MKRYSNISLGRGKATVRNAKHNERSQKPNYLLIHTKKYFWVNTDAAEVEKMSKHMMRNISNNRVRQGKKKISTQTHIMKEFVVTLNKNHRSKTMYQIADYLQGYKFTILQLSLHWDEGILVERSNLSSADWNLDDYMYDPDKKKWLDQKGKVVYDIIAYQPNVDIFWNEKKEKWYHDREYKNTLDMTKVKYKINRHGHILVLNLDDEGNSIARTLRPHLSQIQKDIARITNMPLKEKSKRKGQNHMDYKKSAAISAKEDEVKRRNIELYNENRFLLKKLGLLNPEILHIENFQERQKFVNKIIDNYLVWRDLAILQYRSLGFEYKEGDLTTMESIKRLIEKIESDQNFIKEVFNIFEFEEGLSLPNALRKIQGKSTKTGELFIPSSL